LPFIILSLIILTHSLVIPYHSIPIFTWNHFTVSVHHLLSSVSILASLTAAGQDAEQLRWLVKGAPDPAVIKSHDGDGYFVFSTGKGISIWRSTDLKQWNFSGRVFDEAVPAWAKRVIPESDSLWAPDIKYVGGRYYLYYSVSTFGSQRSVIGLAVNSNLDPESRDYKWDDRGLVIESFPERNDYNAIDPALFIDDDGRAFLFCGSYWTGIKATEVDPRTGKPSSPQPKVTAVVRRRDGAPTSIEAPFVIKRKGFYYLFVSWDFCCAAEKSTYKVMVGRSRSPLGPYVDDSGRKMNDGAAKLVLMGDRRWRGPGHNSVLQTPDGDWLVYHVIDAKSPAHGRILQIRPIQWKDDWPTVGDPITHPPTGPAKPNPLVGRWEHVVNGRDHYDIFLEANGIITGTEGDAFWEVAEDRLLMKWKYPSAPGGLWIDRVRLKPDHHSYEGKNQNGILIQGRKL